MNPLSTLDFPGFRVHRIVVGSFQENSYLVQGPDGRGFLVDPGGEPDRILEAVERAGARPEAILLTHAHLDHVGALDAVRSALGIPAHLHPDARPTFDAVEAQGRMFGLVTAQPAPPDGDLLPGPLEVGGLGLEVRHTPGHADGHVSLVLPGVVLAGDALFQGSIGRTDFPGGSLEVLLASIRREILSLAPGTVVLPGHGSETTVGEEIRANPFLRG